MLLDHAVEEDLPELARIAEHNFRTSKNYAGLPSVVISRFVERNSAQNLRIKLHSGRHRIWVARDPQSRRPLAFYIVKMLNGKCAMATRIHVSNTPGIGRIGPSLHQFVTKVLHEDGYELLYAEASGEALETILRAGFLYVDSYANKAIRNARIDRVVLDLHAGSGTELEESAFLPHLSPEAPYATFVRKYGLVIERLYKKVERMHLAGSSDITQSLFAHVENGLILGHELRDHLGKWFGSQIQWDDVDTMWLFHDIGEIGMDADIPSYKKTRFASLEEEKKARRILESVRPRELRTTLVGLHERYLHRKSTRTRTLAEVDKEAHLCALIDKLEAAIFIGESGIAEVWKKRVGRWIFEYVIRRHALGAFIEPLGQIVPFLDASEKAYLRDRLVGIVTSYWERELVSKAFLKERVEMIETTCGLRRIG